MKARVALLIAALAGSPMEEALAWGTSGHSVIAEIAQRRLAPHVQEQLHDLLGGAISLASIASWADNVALLRPATAGWHFVNIPYDASSYDPGRDCAQQSGCVIEAIVQFRGALAERSAPRTKRAEALMFLVHLVGDVHQPLHCIDRADAGGSQLAVTFFDQPMSLHAVWDYGLIEKNTLDWGAYVRRLEESWLPGKDIKALARGTPVEWAWQAHMAAIEVAYVLPEDHKLGEAYYRRALPMLDQQLALAGIRLARLLNEALGNP